MFDIGWQEFALIGVVALVAIGPKELPGALRTAGKWVGKARRMAQDFQNQFQEALREADVAEMKRQFDDAANAASQVTSGNLLGSVKDDIEGALKIDTDSSEAKPAAIEQALQGAASSHDEGQRNASGDAATGVDVRPSEAAPALGEKLS